MPRSPWYSEKSADIPQKIYPDFGGKSVLKGEKLKCSAYEWCLERLRLVDAPQQPLWAPSPRPRAAPAPPPPRPPSTAPPSRFLVRAILFGFLQSFQNQEWMCGFERIAKNNVDIIVYHLKHAEDECLHVFSCTDRCWHITAENGSYRRWTKKRRPPSGAMRPRAWGATWRARTAGRAGSAPRLRTRINNNE